MSVRPSDLGQVTRDATTARSSLHPSVAGTITDREDSHSELTPLFDAFLGHVSWILYGDANAWWEREELGGVVGMIAELERWRDVVQKTQRPGGTTHPGRSFGGAEARD